MEVAVLGAGAIGTYVGGCLLAAGMPVTLIGRAAMRERIGRHGLFLTDQQGRMVRISADRVACETSPTALADKALILVTVKSAGTAEAATLVARYASPGSIVLSLQNGVDNVGQLRAALPDQFVLGGMVPFNVVPLTDGRLHRGTAGELMVESSPHLAPWLRHFQAAGLPLELREDFREVQWGKLILNLNNAVNALSGLPLKVQLSSLPFRRVFAAMIDEALLTLDAAGIEPAHTGRAAPRQLPGLLRLPDADFLRVAGGMVSMSIEARSSMWQDLEAGRLTEVEDLNGAVVRLGARHGIETATNRAICERIHDAERGANRAYSGEELARACGVH